MHPQVCVINIIVCSEVMHIPFTPLLFGFLGRFLDDPEEQRVRMLE